MADRTISPAGNTSLPDSDAELAALERRASLTVPVERSRWALIIFALIFLITPFFPHAGTVTGWDVILRTPNAIAHSTNMFESIYAWVSLAAAINCILVAVTARRQLAQIGVILNGLGGAMGMVAVWLRQARPPSDRGGSPAIFLYIGVFATIAAGVVLILLVAQRTQVQWELDSRRRVVAGPTEPVLMTQNELLEMRRGQADDDRDDRRARAKARRERTRALDEARARAARAGDDRGVTPPVVDEA